MYVCIYIYIYIYSIWQLCLELAVQDAAIVAEHVLEAGLLSLLSLSLLLVVVGIIINWYYY